MAALNFALCFTPRMSSPMIIKIIIDAGRLIIPFFAGGLVKNSGKPNPTAMRALLKYPDQPFATAAIAIPYSSSKIQPTIQAMNSPKAT